MALIAETTGHSDPNNQDTSCDGERLTWLNSKHYSLKIRTLNSLDLTSQMLAKSKVN